MTTVKDVRQYGKRKVFYKADNTVKVKEMDEEEMANWL